MNSDLKVTRIDSPLVRGAEGPEGRLTAAGAERRATDALRNEPRAAAERTTPVAPRRRTREPRSSPEPADTDTNRIGPPSVDEPLALISHRVPESLKVNLGLFTRALRERRRGGAPVSQKTLPEQEVLALALWLLGDARNDDDVQRVAAAHDEYRARQMTAAAEALKRLA